jgi:hypothetical protein
MDITSARWKDERPRAEARRPRAGKGRAGRRKGRVTPVTIGLTGHTADAVGGDRAARSGLGQVAVGADGHEHGLTGAEEHGHLRGRCGRPPGPVRRRREPTRTVFERERRGRQVERLVVPAERVRREFAMPWAIANASPPSESGPGTAPGGPVTVGATGGAMVAVAGPFESAEVVGVVGVVGAVVVVDVVVAAAVVVGRCRGWPLPMGQGR